LLTIYDFLNWHRIFGVRLLHVLNVFVVRNSVIIDLLFYKNWFPIHLTRQLFQHSHQSWKTWKTWKTCTTRDGYCFIEGVEMVLRVWISTISVMISRILSRSF
jgi:hypothetical protein